MTRRDHHDEYLGQRVFGSLDGLRAVSVIAVIWHHTAGGAAGFTQGTLGVDFFFAISGFLITTLLLRERAATGRINLRAFYVRRALRIFPLYYAVLAAYVLLVYATKRHTAEGQTFIHDIPAFATYTTNWFVVHGAGADGPFYLAWSLATEEQFYLVWPAVLIAVLCLGRNRLGLACSMIAGIAAVGITASQLAPAEPTLPTTIAASIAPAICAGAFMALVLHGRAAFDVVGPVLRHRAAAPALILLLAVLIITGVDHVVIGVAMAALVGALCIREDHVLAPVLRFRALAYIGSISYGMYLMHMLAANAVRIPLHQQYGTSVFVATLVLVTIVAAISFRYFETPLLRLRKRFTPRRQVTPKEVRSGALSNPHPATIPSD